MYESTRLLVSCGKAHGFPSEIWKGLYLHLFCSFGYFLFKFIICLQDRPGLESGRSPEWSRPVGAKTRPDSRRSPEWSRLVGAKTRTGFAVVSIHCVAANIY